MADDLDVLSPSPASSRRRFLPAGNRQRKGRDFFLPAGNSARILLTTYLAYVLALKGGERADGRWRVTTPGAHARPSVNRDRGIGQRPVTTPGANAPPLPSAGSGQALNQEGSLWRESGGELWRALARRFRSRNMPVEPTMYMKTQGLRGNSRLRP